MSRRRQTLELDTYLAGLSADAVGRCDVPERIAAHAVAATLRSLGGEPSDFGLQVRARAYFWSVVRKEVLRCPDAGRARARFLLSAAVRDLEQAGRGPSEVWEELARGWAGRVPENVLEEYQRRLCA